ncbi:tenascin-like isoform X2 [Pieris napi]|uniref:tenascin-like isoform X2 n=1 Tax=Pieris napi TaxID=78633 RepID=UPI001FB94173|nr:tenascin-like isoform X2 [Pieris napi]
MALNLLVLVSIIYCTSAYDSVNVYEEDATILKECTPATCNQLCRRMGFPGGDCINKRCECEKLVDKLETDSSSLRSCNFRECEQRCRRLGFPGGACVGDRCKCDNFRASEGIADTENNNDLTFDAGDMDVNQLRSCNLRACEQLCRRLGFRGGACVGDKCKCDNFRASESIPDTENNNDLTFDAGDMDVNQLRSCNLRACEQLCRRLGFRGGACVGDKCKCDNFRASESIPDTENNNDLTFDAGDMDVNQLRSCNLRACEQLCRRLGFRGGACVGDKCKCDNFRASESIPDTENNNDLTFDAGDMDVNQLRSCNLRACEQLCRRLGFRGGACVSDKCKCDNFRASESIPDTENNNDVSYDAGDMDVNQLRSCNLRACEQLCRRLGFRGGACVGDKCKCDNFRASESIPDTENNNDVSYDAGDMDVNQLRSCNLRACEQLCRRLGFRGGACVGDKCKCDNFRASEGIADTENNNDVSYDAGEMDVNPLRRCNLWACEQHCRRLGFHGTCVGDKCKCDNFRTPKDEFSEAASTLRDCNYQECDQRCRRLGFPGGACVGSRCKCDNFRSTQFSRGLDSAKINTEYRSCNYRECDRRCRRLKFPGGACVNNQCKCYNFRQLLSNEESLATNATENPLENDVKCDSTQCKTSCSERGLRNGICIEKECYCDMEDAETSSQPCEPHACNDSCQIMNRLGGFCLLGKCNCY